MAIERYALTSQQDVADLVGSLGWFDEVTLYNTDQSVLCIKDGKRYLEISQSIGGNASWYGVNFFINGGNNITFGKTTTISGYYLNRAFKTRNGIIFRSNESSSYPLSFLLGKTNDGAIAVAIPTDLSPNPPWRSAAIEEAWLYDEQFSLKSLSNTGYDRGVWPDSPMVVSFPIPTHPANGTRYIKGALGLIVASFTDFGIVEIDGVRYATDGRVALNDED